MTGKLTPTQIDRNLEYIRGFSRDYPELLDRINQAVCQGVKDKLSLLNVVRLDMETIAVMVLSNALFKGNETFVAYKLEQHKDNLSNCVDHLIVELHKKAEQRKPK